MKTTMKAIVTLICGIWGGCYIANTLGHVIMSLLDSVSVTFGRVGISIMTNTHYEIVGWNWLGTKMLPFCGIVFVEILLMILVDLIGELIHE